MNESVKITYVNRTMDQDIPPISLFIRNEIPTFDDLRNQVAWRVIEQLRKGETRDVQVPYPTVNTTTVLGETFRTDEAKSKFRMMIVTPPAEDGSQRSEIFEPNLEGKSEMAIGVYGNAQDGYRFKIDDWK